MIRTLVSGGQTGVDRAALDVALERGLPIGGWCPSGRRAEDGPLAPRYGLRETPLADYAQRTLWNVRDSDGTLVLTAGPPRGGTALTVEEAGRQGKPVLVIDLADSPPPWTSVVGSPPIASPRSTSPVPAPARRRTSTGGRVRT